MRKLPPDGFEIMSDWIFRENGSAAGFIHGHYIRDLNGRAIAQIRGSRVHTMSGSYVGELHHQMVVNMNRGNPGSIGSSGNPGSVGSGGNPGRRGVQNYGCRDVFDKLL